MSNCLTVVTWWSRELVTCASPILLLLCLARSWIHSTFHYRKSWDWTQFRLVVIRQRSEVNLRLTSLIVSSSTGVTPSEALPITEWAKKLFDFLNMKKHSFGKTEAMSPTFFRDRVGLQYVSLERERLVWQQTFDLPLLPYLEKSLSKVIFEIDKYEHYVSNCWNRKNYYSQNKIEFWTY